MRVAQNIKLISQINREYKVNSFLFHILYCYLLRDYFILFKMQILKMKKIDEKCQGSINYRNGKSKLFKSASLKAELIINDDFYEIFLLFLPNYLMETPLHFYLIRDDYEYFSRISDQINDNKFDAFLNYNKNNNNVYFTKIKEMFIFILENISAFNLKAIDDFYCTLIDDSEEIENYTRLPKNIERIQGYLKKIKVSILNDGDIQSRSALIYKNV